MDSLVLLFRPEAVLYASDVSFHAERRINALPETGQVLIETTPKTLEVDRRRGKTRFRCFLGGLFRGSFF